MTEQTTSSLRCSVQIARLKNLRNVSFTLRRFPLDSVSFLILLLMSYGVV
jgi:hypothetical protein